MITKEKFLDFKQRFPLDGVVVNQLRDQAYNAFNQKGYPNKKDEAWKYTSLLNLKDVDWNLSSIDDANGLSHEDMKAISNKLPSEFTNLVFVNGFINQTLSDDCSDFYQSVEITTEDFKSLDIESESKVLDLQKAGLFSKNKISFNKLNSHEKVVHVVFVQKNTKSTLTQPFTEVIVEQNFEAKLIVSYVSLNSSTENQFINSHLTVYLNKNAKLQYLQLQDSALKDTHVSRTVFHIADHAQLISLDLALGTKLARHYLGAHFKGEGATAHILGLVVASGEQHIDQYTYIQHEKGHNSSNQKYKSILAGKSHSVFRGRVRIEQDAQKANSEQLNNNLLLTRESGVNTVPQLEIYADDVKATHGSTVGQLSHDEIFYFMSRGVDAMTATQLLAAGFAYEMTQFFSSPDLSQFAQKHLKNKLDGIISNV